MKRETYRTMVFSTAHMEERDTVVLNGLSAREEGGVTLTHYGWRVHTAPDRAAWAEHRGYLKKKGLSESCLKVLEIARDGGCPWVEFDRDGEQYSDLKTFDW